MALFQSSRSSLGLDIGSSSVKLMELAEEPKTGRQRLTAFGMARLPPEAIVDGAVMNAGAIVDAQL